MSSRSIACTLIAGFLLAAAAGAGAAVTPNGLVILCTDYGADSIYVGELKGAVYSRFAGAKVDAITNSIPSFDILTGAFILAEGAAAYPPGTTFCCVVDPGVGSARRCIVLETENGHRFVAPDNGLLSVVAARNRVNSVRECSNKALWREGATSSTFHGRDIMGPVAASLAKGASLDDVGPAIADMKKLELPKATLEEDRLDGVVIRTDWYGNIVTNIRASDLEEAGFAKGDALQAELNGKKLRLPYAASYSSVPVGENVLVIQSAGFVELAINQGSLVEALKAAPKDAVRITKAP